MSSGVFVSFLKGRKVYKQNVVFSVNFFPPPKKIKLMGDALGTDFMMYQTTSGSQIDCIVTRLNAANPSEIVVPGESIVTLVNSNY
jgi:hypothetical protein